MKDQKVGKLNVIITPQYLKIITAGGKIYYFVPETGKFDGVSWDIKD
jgi:hypothetical protein